jgi:hypothetical protein
MFERVAGTALEDEEREKLKGGILGRGDLLIASMKIAAY